MAEWKKVSTQNDIDELLDYYGGFHDSCIVAVNYQSGIFVDDEKVMHLSNATEHEATITFHSQWRPAIELRFVGVRQFHLTGWQDNYLNDISDAYLSFHKGILPGAPSKVIVWANTDYFDIKNIDNSIHEPSDTYIVANELSWRIIGE